jgi:hypothetical protein
MQAEDRTGELTGGQTDGQRDGQRDGQTDVQTDGQSERAIDKLQENEWIYVSGNNLDQCQIFASMNHSLP